MVRFASQLSISRIEAELRRDQEISERESRTGHTILRAILEYFDSTLFLILDGQRFSSDQLMISLDEIRRNSEQLVDCTVRIEQLLMQLAVVE